jgi:nucleoside-diphosphate kinase
MKERTLSIIKPDAIGKGLVGEVIKRFEEAGFKIIAMKMVHVSKEQAEGFYAVHKGRDFFEGFITFMCTGPWVVMVLEGEDVIARSRKLMGATDPKDAAEGTIRREFATDGRRNVVHGSDGAESAAFEIGYFFNALELVGG